MASKESWPELVGKTADQAKEAILADNRDLKVQVVREGMPVTMDFRQDRVRIVVKEDNTVVSTPVIG